MAGFRIFAVAVALSLLVGVVQAADEPAPPAGGALPAAGPQEAAPAPAAQIAVINIGRLFNEAKIVSHLAQQMNERIESVRREKFDRMKKIEELSLSIDAQPEEAKRRAIQAEVQKLQVELKAWTEWQEDRIKKAHAEQTVDIMKAISSVSGQVATRRGFQIVVQSGHLLLDPNANAGQAVRAVTVIWYANELDITDEVLKALDEKFEEYLKGLEKKAEKEKEAPPADPAEGAGDKAEQPARPQ